MKGRPSPAELVQEIATRYANFGSDIVGGPAAAFLHGVAIGAMGAATVDIGELLETVLNLQRLADKGAPKDGA